MYVSIVFNVYNNKKCFLKPNKILEIFLREHVTLKTGVITGLNYSLQYT